jgi:hypothetical protein
MLPKAMGAAYRGRFLYVAALYHIFGQNQSVMALQNRRTPNSLMLVNAEKREFSVAAARIGRKMLFKFIRHALPILGVGWRLFFGRNIGPAFGEIRVDFQPLLDAWLSVGLNRLHGAFRLTDTAIDAFVGMDDQHIFALVEAIHGANFDAVHVFTFDTIVVDDIGHLTL